MSPLSLLQGNKRTSFLLSSHPEMTQPHLSVMPTVPVTLETIPRDQSPFKWSFRVPQKAAPDFTGQRGFLTAQPVVSCSSHPYGGGGLSQQSQDGKYIFMQAKTKAQEPGVGAGLRGGGGVGSPRLTLCRQEKQPALSSGPKNKNSLIGLHSPSLLWTCGLDPENNCSL